VHASGFAAVGAFLSQALALVSYGSGPSH